jgi:Undecaprenyl-phosphate glucose phosphotransferase
MLSGIERTSSSSVIERLSNDCEGNNFRVSAPVARVLLDVVEFTSIVALGLLSGVGYAYFGLGGIGDVAEASGITLVAAVFYASLRGLRKTQAINGPTRLTREMAGVLASWLVVVTVMSFIAFLMKASADYSRGFVLVFATVVPAALGALRWQYARLARPTSGPRRISWKVMVLGDLDELHERGLEERLQPLGVEIAGAFALLSAAPSRHGLGEVDQRTIERLIEACRQTAADEILLMLPWRDDVRIHAVLDELARVPLPVRLLVDRSLENVMSRSASGWGRLASIEVQRAPLTLSEQMQKRALDIVVAGTALVVLLPLLACVAALIKLESKGPVLFKQHRNGFNGRVFKIYKFRSMTTVDDGAVIRQATRNDARVTRVGRFLRRSSIDELPQLWNVLVGDMSVVGPRPHAVAHNIDYNRKIARYVLRHYMRPGLTGWAQVNGYRGETPHLWLMERRVEHDIWYVNNWSIWLDIRIMLRTGRALLQMSAY